MTNSQQNLNNKADHQFGNGKYMTHAQKIEFVKSQEQMTNETKKTAVEWLEEQIIKFHNWKRNPVFDENCFDEIELNKAIKKAKEMEKEQRAVQIQKFIDKVNEKIDRELGWCGGPRNKSFEMENWRKAYANVRKWMQNLNKEFYEQTYGGNK